MTVEQNASPVDQDRLAAAARSILSCPDDVELVVDGVTDVTLGLADGDGLAIDGAAGRPVFTCPIDSPLALAGCEGRGALLTMTSRWDGAGTTTLTLAGRLETTGEQGCDCCTRTRAVLTLHLSYVLVTVPEADQPLRVPLEAFLDTRHALNRGYLHRATEHANHCHQDELRRAVATITDTRASQILGVGLADLGPRGVTLTWVDHEGGHRRTVDFGRPAQDPADLGELLRGRLHAGLC